ncbi:MAG: Eco57I restriction-modification methylase domain-containing protein [Candidatus Hermodarchaeota archaeon]
MTKIKSLGQYFTPLEITQLMVSMISQKKDCSILEPCAGKGIFLKSLSEAGFRDITAIELDSTLENITNIDRLTMDFFDFPVQKKFDVVIGNPPYVRWKNLSVKQREIWQQRSLWGRRMNGLTDILQPFIFKAVDHLKPEGELIFITPIFWMQTLYAAPLRTFLLENGILEAIFDFHEHIIFPGVNVNLIIFKYRKTRQKEFIRIVNIHGKKKITKKKILLGAAIYHELLEVKDTNDLIKRNQIEGFLKKQPQDYNPWRFIPDPVETELSFFEDSCQFSPLYPIAGQKTKLSELLTKQDLETRKEKKSDWISIEWQGRKYWRKKRRDQSSKIRFSENMMKGEQRHVRLGDLVEIGNGLVSGLDKAFRVPKGLRLNTNEEKLCVSVIKARSLRRYYSDGPSKYFLIKPGQIQSEEELKDEYPNLFSHLQQYKSALEQRYQYDRIIPYWEWVFLRNLELMENHSALIFVPCKERFDTRQYIRFALCRGSYYSTQDVTVIAKDAWVKESVEYLLAFLNSDMMFKWIVSKGFIRGGVAEFSESPLSNLPIRLINWNNPTETVIHQKITDLIQMVLDKKCEETTRKIHNQIENLITKLLKNLVFLRK